MEKVDVKVEHEKCKKDPLYFIENYVKDKQDEKEKRILKVILDHAEKLGW